MERGNRARKVIRFIFLKDPSGCWEEDGLGQGVKAGQPGEEAVVIIQGRNAGASGSEGGQAGGGFC